MVYRTRNLSDQFVYKYSQEAVLEKVKLRKVNAEEQAKT
jgi:hypothetical protein